MTFSDRRLAVFFIAAAMAVQATGAAADSRIFSVKSDTAGVTIDQAFRGDEALSVVGRGDEATLFRIDNRPATPVPCVNRLTFVTSTGERIEQAPDLCSLNWELTLDVAAPDDSSAAAASPAPPPAPAAAPAPGGYSETVTIRADDPAAVIAAVSLDHQPVGLKGPAGNPVQIEVQGAADEGIVCERDLEIALSDGRRFARQANICLDGWSVVVALGEGPGAMPAAPPVTKPPANPPPRVAVPAATPPPATSTQTAPPAVSTQGPPLQPPAVSTQGPPRQPPAVSTQAPPPVRPPVVGGPATLPPQVSEYVWSFGGSAAFASLIFGLPQTDASAFLASCSTNSGRITVRLPESAARVVSGAPVPITFSTATFVKTYPGVGSRIDDLSGASQPMVEIPATDPLWGAIARDSSLSIAVAPAPPVSVSLRGSAGPTRQFLAACSPPIVRPPPVMPPPVVAGPRPGPGITVDYACAGGPFLRVTYNGRAQTALLSEPGAPPMLLYFVPGGVGAVYGNGPARLVSIDDRIRWSRYGPRAGSVVCRSR